MKYQIKSVLLPFALCAIGSFSTVYPEGNCPPGYFPMTPPGAQGPQGCAPIPNYDQAMQQEATISWASRWGALSSDDGGHIAGVANDRSSKAEAIQAAIDDCRAYGGKGCKADAFYGNQCIAVVSGDQRSDTITATTIKQAQAEGMQRCERRNDSNCHTYYSACSLPIQIN